MLDMDMPKMGIFDSHAHYDDERFDDDRDALLSGMKGAGVDYIVNVSSSMDTLHKTLEIAESYPFVYGSAGVHPSECSGLTESDIDIIKKACDHEKIVAIGEIGLDYHYPEPSRELQKKWFGRQLSLAAECDMPVIIHSREAAEDTYDILGSYDKSLRKDNRGVIHCFSYSAEMAKRYIDMGYYIGVGGVVTFSNAKKLKKTVCDIPLEKIVIETDCPYLAPAPHRGERNDSSLLCYVVKEIAGLKNVSEEEVIKVTAYNAAKMYGIEV